MQKILKPLLAVKTKSGYSIFTAIVVALFSTWVIFDATKAEVVVAADGDVQTVKTHTTTVGELFDDLGIDIGKYDELSHGKNDKIVDGMKIRYKTANKIYVTIDDETTKYYTTAMTVGEFLEEEQIKISKYDHVSHNDMAVLNDGLEIKIKKAFPVRINIGGKEEVVKTTGGTVQEILKNNNIEFTKKTDKIDPNLDEVVEKDTEITITHVEKETIEIVENVPYQTEEKQDSSLDKGEMKTISEGKEGKVLKIYEVIKENGEEVDRKLKEEIVEEASENKVVAVGTKPNDTNSNSTEEKDGKALTMQATAYAPNCGGCSGYTATGINIKQDPTPKVISVDPNVIPLGSRVWVEGYGEAIAGDTGGAIKGNRIDVLVPSVSSANSWGRKTVKVKILN